MADPTFSLVIPCYNEAASLPELVLRARFTAEAGDGEVILVDNGSTDSTPELLAELLADGGRVRTLRVDPNEGYGWGITQGLLAARAPIVGWTHADLQTDPADALRAVAAMEGADRVLVKGHRYGRPLADRVFTAGMTVFETVLLRRRGLADINAQPTMFHRDLLGSWDKAPKDFALDLFALYTAVEHGYQVRRVPVVFAPRRFGSSSWNVDMAAKRKFIRRTVDFSLALRKEL